jgi:hypothetical protein
MPVIPTLQEVEVQVAVRGHLDQPGEGPERERRKW